MYNKKYTLNQVVVKAYMNYASSWNRILDSEGWGRAGLFVKDNKYSRNPQPSSLLLSSLALSDTQSL